MSSKCLLCCSYLLIFIELGFCKDIYISHKGKDDKSCGKNPAKTCQTLEYAVSVSAENDVLHLDSTGGPYTVEPVGSYINITHSIFIRTRTYQSQQKAIVTCAKSDSRLFDIFDDARNNRTKPVTLTLENIKITGCIGQWDSPSVIHMSDASLKIKDCSFSSNGVVLQNARISNSTNVGVTITGSKFTSNGISKPYVPAIRLLGCDSVNMIINQSEFHYTAISIQTEKNTSLGILGTVFSGQNLRGPSLDVILSSDQNKISIVDSVVSQHNHSKDSAIKVSVNAPPSHQPTVHFNNVTFMKNQNAHSLGAALSIFSRFDTNKNPVSLNVLLSDCTFTQNSAQDEGGALYVQGISNIRMNHCVFNGSSATNGGAVFITRSAHITIFNTTFSNNKAFGSKHYKGVGGAIKIISSDINLNYCKFNNNGAPFRGQSIHALDIKTASIMHTQFENNTTKSSYPQTEVHLEQISPAQNSKGPSVMLKNNIYSITHGPDHNGLFHINVIGSITSSGNQLCCPAGQHVEYLTEPQHVPSEYDDSTTLEYAWCTACPAGTYNLQRQCITPETESSLQENRSSMIQAKPAHCLKCPDNAQCAGAGQIIPLRNYWGHISHGNATFEICPKGYCDQEDCIYMPCCSANRTGQRCGKCSDDYLYDLTSKACLKNDQCEDELIFALIYSVAFSFIYFALILLLVVLSRLCLFQPMVSKNIHGHPSDVSQDDSISQQPLWGSSPVLDNDDRIGTNSLYWEGDASPSVSAVSDTHSHDSGSDSFEPSIDIGHSGSHGLVPLNDHETQTSAELNKRQETTGNSNLVTVYPLVLCLTWMLLQLFDVIYTPWSDKENLNYKVIRGMADIINLQPIFSPLRSLCMSGSMAAIWKEILGLCSLAAMFVILLVITCIVKAVLFIVGRLRHSELLAHNTRCSVILCQMFLVLVLLTYVPVVRICYRLSHCVSSVDSPHEVLFINSEVQCNRWWVWFVRAVLIVQFAPLGICIWYSVYMLQNGLLCTTSFITSLIFPLPAIICLGIRNVICRCRQSGDHSFVNSIDSEGILVHLTPAECFINEFFSLPFTKPHALSRARGSPYGDTAETSNTPAWIIYLMSRTFILVTLSVLLDHSPNVKAILLVFSLLLMMALHIFCHPYYYVFAHCFEVVILGVLAILSVINMNNAMVYSVGLNPYGQFIKMLKANDWIYLVITGLSTVGLLIITTWSFVRAAINKKTF